MPPVDAGSRDERRALKVTAVTAGLAFPNAQPSRSCAGAGSAGKKKGYRETVYAVTSLTATQATPAGLAAIIRGHQAIEKCSADCTYE